VPSAPIEELRLLSRLDRNTMVALGAVLSAAGIAFGCREAAPVAIYGAPAPPEQVQPAPSAAPPPAAPAPSDTTVMVPAPSASASVMVPAPSASASVAPSKPPKPRASSQPFAPATAYGVPPRMGPPGGVAPVAPFKPDTKQ
jgi:preprotein translocase subunit SecD